MEKESNIIFGVKPVIEAINLAKDIVINEDNGGHMKVIGEFVKALKT